MLLLFNRTLGPPIASAATAKGGMDPETTAAEEVDAIVEMTVRRDTSDDGSWRADVMVLPMPIDSSVKLALTKFMLIEDVKMMIYS